MVSAKVRKKATVNWFRILQGAEISTLAWLILLVQLTNSSLQTQTSDSDKFNISSFLPPSSSSSFQPDFSLSPLYSPPSASSTSQSPSVLNMRMTITSTNTRNTTQPQNDFAVFSKTPAKVRKKRNLSRLKVKNHVSISDSTDTEWSGAARLVRTPTPNHCKPIPKEVLWKRIYPRDSYSDYLTKLAEQQRLLDELYASAMATTKPGSRAFKNGRKRGGLDEQHSKRVTSSRFKRFSRGQSSNLLRELGGEGSNDNPNLRRYYGKSNKNEGQASGLIRSKSLQQYSHVSSGNYSLKSDDTDLNHYGGDYDSYASSKDYRSVHIRHGGNVGSSRKSPSSRTEAPRWQKSLAKKRKSEAKLRRSKDRKDDEISATRTRRGTLNESKELHKRQKARKKQLHHHDPSSAKLLWHCRLEKYWKQMPSGTYPAYVLTGRCVNKHCMDRMYECRPKRYAVNVMRKNEGVCNPLPLISSSPNVSTSLEESWTMGHYKVTVACECSRPKRSGVSQIFMRQMPLSSETSIIQQQANNGMTSADRNRESDNLSGTV